MRVPARINPLTPMRFPIRKPLDPSCVLNLPFREGTGSIANDQTIFQNNGAINGATWIPNGKIGSALSFDGTDDYASCATDSSIDNIRDLSVLAWVKITTPANSQKIVHKSSGAGQGYILGIDNSQVIHEIWDEEGDRVYLSTGAVGTAWTLIGFTYKTGGLFKSYINGVLTQSVSAGDSPVHSTTTDLWIGGASWSGGQYFLNGLIGEVRIYNRALSAEEIKRLYLLTK